MLINVREFLAKQEEKPVQEGWATQLVLHSPDTKTPRHRYGQNAQTLAMNINRLVRFNTKLPQQLDRFYNLVKTCNYGTSGWAKHFENIGDELVKIIQLQRSVVDAIIVDYTKVPQDLGVSDLVDMTELLKANVRKPHQVSLIFRGSENPYVLEKHDMIKGVFNTMAESVSHYSKPQGPSGRVVFSPEYANAVRQTIEQMRAELKHLVCDTPPSPASALVEAKNSWVGGIKPPANIDERRSYVQLLTTLGKYKHVCA